MSGFELTAIIFLSMLFGALLVLFYFTVVKEKPVRIMYQDRINKLENDGLIETNRFKYKEDIIYDSTEMEEEHTKPSTIKEFTKHHKKEITLFIAILLGCLTGNLLGNIFFNDLSKTIHDNHKPISYTTPAKSE
jgi:hypothetical protein